MRKIKLEMHNVGVTMPLSRLDVPNHISASFT